MLVDLPGVQRPRDALTERMAEPCPPELAGADAALLMINGEQGIGPGDGFIAQSLRTANLPVTLAVNKIDRLTRGADGRGAQRGRRAGAGGRDLSDLGPHGRGSRGS